MKEEVTTTLRWMGDWPWYLGIGAALALAIAAAVLYRRDTRVSGRLPAIALPLLRALAVFLIVVMLSGPVLHHRKTIGELARLIIALDGSESMQLHDAAMDAGRKIAIAERLGILTNVGTALDLPGASQRLGDARSISAGISAMEEVARGNAVATARGEFAAKIAEAGKLIQKGSGDDELNRRFSTELGKPAGQLAARELTASDDRMAASAELVKLGDIAGRWSADISERFEKKIGNDPAASRLKEAIARVDALPRWQRVQALLLEGKDGKRLLEQLSKQHDVQVVLLTNGEVTPVWRPDAGPASVLPAKLPEPEGELTDLTSGLFFAVGDENKAGKGAVILFTDGQQNSGDSPIEAAKILKGRGMPVFTVGMGSVVPPRDIAVLKTVVPDSVFYKDRVRAEVVLKEELAAGQPFTLSVKDGDKVVFEKQLVTEGRAIRRVPVEFPVKEIAEARIKASAVGDGFELLGVPLELTVGVSGVEGDREASNNEAPMRIRTVTQKQKILILDGRPRWESRYLRNLFERDEKWEVNSIIAGSTSDAGIIRGGMPGQFPNDRKLLDTYDLIIFGEVPKSLLNADELTWLRDFVEKRGGAMIIIDGARGVLGDYVDTALGPLIPVEWPAGATAVRGGVKSLRLSERASSLAPFMLSDDLAGNADAWAKLPPPHWLSGGRPLAGAEVLIEGDTGGAKIPAAVIRLSGAGRVYYQAFDDSWRWRYEVGDLHHVKFWNQLASYVAEPPFAARDKFVSIDAGKLTYQLGDRADLRVRMRDIDGKPVTDAAVNAVLYRDGKKVATIALSPDAGGLYRGKTAALEPGSYEMAAESAALPEGQLKARTQFNVTARESAERTLLSVNEPLLRQISILSGGDYFREEQCDELIATLAPLSTGSVEERDTVLWQEWPWFALIVALLTIEWIVRKRTGML